MCTVTFIPAGDTVFITHNRDEKSIRSKAIPPKQYEVNGHQLLFPRDSQAGGTWVAVHENGSAAVLLNGAFVKHIYQPPYRKSRGLAFLDIVASNNLWLSWKTIDLEKVEPFTIILWGLGELHECRWDGQQKCSKSLDPSQFYTWSSVTLYHNDIIDKRRKWFENWIKQEPLLNSENIVGFHLSAGDGDRYNDLRMNRNGEMLTVSVTAIELTASKGIVNYIDLQEGMDYTQELLFTKYPVNK
jgi:uncharacterized protein with NRDE domain